MDKDVWLIKTEMAFSGYKDCQIHKREMCMIT